MFARWLTFLFAAVLVFAAGATQASEQSVALRTEPAPTKASDADSAKRLIAQLGSDDFSKRREAEAELIKLGAAAFDSLQDAQANTDLEIATQSQYLLHRIPIDWVRPADAEEVRNLMANYAPADGDDRY